MTDGGPRVRFNRVGTEISADQEVFGKGYANEVIIIADPSEDGRHLIVQVLHGSAADKAEIWTKDLTKKGPFELITKGIDARFFAFAGDSQIFLQTNWKAPRGRVLAVDFANPARERWREIIPQTHATSDTLTIAAATTLVSYVKNVSSEAKIFQPDGKPAGEVAFPAL